MNHGSLTTGIGGFDLAAEWLGWKNIFQVEKDEFCLNVLKYHFPKTKRYGDIKKFKGTKYKGAIYVLSCGMPCQPFSIAGMQAGEEDDRYLWCEVYRIFREIKPTYFVFENVPGIKDISLSKILSDLEAEGYNTETFVLPAASVNAPHRRYRFFVIAYARCRRNNLSNKRKRSESINITWNGKERIIANPNSTRSQNIKKGQEQRKFRGSNTWDVWTEWTTEPPLCSVDDGFPKGLDGITFSKWRKKSITAYGNAVVPQLVYEIFKAIEIVNNEKNEPQL